MKLNWKKIMLLVCAMGLFWACSMTVFAGNLPTISLSEDHVSVSHEDESEKVKVTVKDWRNSSAFQVKWEVDDPSVAKVELDSQSSDSFKLKIKTKGTGETVVKVWLDGYSRSCKYITVDSINYQKDAVSGYSVRHYGIMTGTSGEAATIDDFEIQTVDGEKRLYVYFTYKDKGANTSGNVTFQAKCEEDDGDTIATQSAVASGMVEGGTGYKIYFRIPNDTYAIKLVNNDL